MILNVGKLLKGMEAAGVEPASGTQERRPFTRVSPVYVLPLPLPRRLRGRGQPP